MKIAYLDCFSGISGDMFLGALVDAGVPPQLFEETVAALGVGATLEISRVMRSGIAATKVDVFSHGEKDLPREVYWAAREKAEHREHAHSHQHGHEEHAHGEHSHEDVGEHSSHGERPRAGAPALHEHSEHGRGLTEIRGIIQRAAIAVSAKRKAIAIFEALGAAEAKIHATDIERIHFHEVGAVDAMVDIVCAAVGAEALGVDEIVCSPLNVGGGTVECAHGRFPVPAPATLALLQGAPVYSSGVEAELVTPTGAAIVATLVKRFAAFPAMKVEKIGYGAGSRDFPRHANVLRMSLGDAVAVERAGAGVRAAEGDTVTVLEANLDDMSPQVFGYVMERLLEEGALDVFAAPVQMKKSRPGSLVTVLARPEDADRLTQVLFLESTTIGVRRREEQRQCLVRRWETVTTPWGAVRMKIASLNGTVCNYAPEYEDCRRIAAEHQVPLKRVIQEAASSYQLSAISSQDTHSHPTKSA